MDETMDETLEERLVRLASGQPPAQPAQQPPVQDDLEARLARMAQPKAKEPLSTAMSTALGLNQVARGYTMGLSDRVIAGGMAAASPDMDYAQARAKIDEGNKQFADEHGAANLILNVGSAFLPGPGLVGKVVGGAAKMIPQAANAGRALLYGTNVAKAALGAGTAGALGTVGYQTGEDDASPMKTLQNALQGFAVGGVVGGATRAIAPVAARIGSVAADLTGLRSFGSGTPAGQVPKANPRSLEGLLYPEQAGTRADRKVLSAVTEGGDIPLRDVFAQSVYNNALSDNQGKVVDLGGKYMERLARGAKNKNIRANAVLDKGFMAREADLLPGIRRDISGTVAESQNTVKLRKALNKEASANSGPLYDVAHPQKFALQPDAITVLTERDPRGMFRAVHKLARNMAQEEDGTVIPPLFAKFDDGTWGLGRDQMQIKELDYMKRAIQEMADSKAAGGKGLGKTTARTMLNNLNVLMKNGDDAVEEFPQARDAFRGPKAQIKAIDMAEKGGRGFGTNNKVPSFKGGSPNELGEYFGGLPPEQQGAYSVGKASVMERDAARDPRAFVKNLARNNDAMDKQMQTTPRGREGKTLELLDRAKVRDDQVQKSNNVMKGSITNESMNDEVATGILSKSGQILYAAKRALVNAAAGRSLGGLQGRTAENVGSRADLTGPLSDEYIRYLMQLEKNTAATSAARGRVGTRALATLLGMQQ